MSRVCGWIVVSAGVSLFCACEANDIGNACQAEISQLSGDLVLGEMPLVEVVSIEVDKECQSFSCLRHRGLSPYCTRDCQGDGDCPAGFRCEPVLLVGDLAAKQFCTRIDQCQQHLDCGDLGSIVCDVKACYDSCQGLSCSIDADCPDALCVDGRCACQFRQLVCQSTSQLDCSCDEESCSCLDSAVGPWTPRGVVGVCQARDRG